MDTSQLNVPSVFRSVLERNTCVSFDLFSCRIGLSEWLTTWLVQKSLWSIKSHWWTVKIAEKTSIRITHVYVDAELRKNLVLGHFLVLLDEKAIHLQIVFVPFHRVQRVAFQIEIAVQKQRTAAVYGAGHSKAFQSNRAACLGEMFIWINFEQTSGWI